MKPASKCPTPGCTRPLLRTTGLCAECSADACRPELPGDGSLTLLSTFRAETCKFRRSRPKRSRVQEMAEAHWGSPPGTSQEACDFGVRVMTAAIRAVCEWLDAWDWKQGCPTSKAAEREFLEPR